MTLRDRAEPAPVVARDRVFTGRVWNVVAETFDLPGAGRLTREFVDHPGAVAILALDEHDAVLVIEQYRHPIGTFEWELPAGLLDSAGEDELATARRELFEEADLRARTWHRLLGYHSSPGGISEHLTIFLARDLTVVPGPERYHRTGEEAVMTTRWVPLDDVLDAVLAGRVQNATLALGCFTAEHRRAGGWAELAPAEPEPAS